MRIHCAGDLPAVLHGAEFAPWQAQDLARRNADTARASGLRPMAVPADTDLVDIAAGNIPEYQAIAIPNPPMEQRSVDEQHGHLVRSR